MTHSVSLLISVCDQTSNLLHTTKQTKANNANNYIHINRYFMLPHQLTKSPERAKLQIHVNSAYN